MELTLEYLTRGLSNSEQMFYINDAFSLRCTSLLVDKFNDNFEADFEIVFRRVFNRDDTRDFIQQVNNFVLSLVGNIDVQVTSRIETGVELEYSLSLRGSIAVLYANTNPTY